MTAPDSARPFVPGDFSVPGELVTAQFRLEPFGPQHSTADYAAWTLQGLLRSPDFEWSAQCADDWRKPWPGFIQTRYHAKAARDERASCFLMFRKI